MRDRSNMTRIERHDVGPFLRVDVTIPPTSFSLQGLSELIAELSAVRDGMLSATTNHYLDMAAEAEATTQE